MSSAGTVRRKRVIGNITAGWSAMSTRELNYRRAVWAVNVWNLESSYPSGMSVPRKKTADRAVLHQPMVSRSTV